MKTMFALVMVGVLVLAGTVQGARASEVCTGVSVSCVRATDLGYGGRVNLVTVATSSEAAARQRANQAYANRYTAMADGYFMAEAAARLRADSAYAARVTAMADDYIASEAAAHQRANQAYADRYTAMADDYLANLAREIVTRPR